MDSIRKQGASASAAPLNLNLNLDLNIDLTSNHHQQQQHDDDDYLAKELNRMNEEHKKLLHNLTLISKHHLNLLSLIQDQEQEQEQDQGMSSFKKPRDSRTTANNKVYRQINPLDTTLIVQDGYEWRKYGQKVTRDNPSPRAYYKCSFAPNCPVKKKVQKSLHDPSLLIAMYQGDHNHPPPPHQNHLQLPSIFENAQPLSIPQSSPTDSQLPLDKFFIDQMASSLVGNSSFTKSLFTTIFEKMLSDDELI